jgi:hypothetical protein
MFTTTRTCARCGRQFAQASQGPGTEAPECVACAPPSPATLEALAGRIAAARARPRLPLFGGLR